jgi:hypothetical protein
VTRTAAAGRAVRGILRPSSGLVRAPSRVALLPARLRKVIKAAASSRALVTRVSAMTKRPLSAGQWVKHDRFGLGVTVSSTDTRVTVQFDDHGVKTFVSDIFDAELVDAPDRPIKRTRKAAAPKA